jgi:hypothetical protein
MKAILQRETSKNGPNALESMKSILDAWLQDANKKSLPVIPQN